jgi:predicted phage tail protein
MSFEQLIAKVKQAEDALEAQERRVSADLRQLKSSWRAAWTPGRIVVAGLVSGFFVGRARPLRAAASGGSLMQMISMVSSLVAGGSAQAAAGEAERAAETTTEVAERAGVPVDDLPHAPAGTAAAPAPPPAQDARTHTAAES